MAELQVKDKVATRGNAAHFAAPRLTFDEFLDWADEDTHAEWVDGEVQFMSPASYDHQSVGVSLAALLRIYVQEKSLGVVLSNPFLMRLVSRPSGREPDVLFVAEANRHRLRENFLDGPADLVVEIVSPESRERDTEIKLREYEAGGVEEYWLIDLPQRRATWYQRGDDGLYQSVAAQDGVYRSRVLAGLWLREEWLWQPPKLLDVLRQWQLI